ncbi:hypothetical protein J2X32_004011 [Rheinheimera pacifica]|nr:hypothetical protein [Rheinheimera pacifica]
MSITTLSPNICNLPSSADNTVNEDILAEFSSGCSLSSEDEAQLLLWLLEWTSLPELD